MQAKVHCPYCWKGNLIKIEGNYSFFSIHPPNFKPRESKSLAFWSVKWPKEKREIEIICNECKQSFHVEFFPYMGGDPRNSKEANYYIELGEGKREILEKKLFLENILDKIGKKLKVNYFSAAIILVIGLWIAFILFPAVIFDQYTKLAQDYGHIIVIITIITSLVFYKRYLLTIRKLLCVESLPLLLHKNYKKTNWCKMFEQQTFKGNLLGHPYKLISPATFCGIIAGALSVLWGFNYMFQVLPALQKEAMLLPFNYDSVYFLMASMPYWFFIYFTVGNIIWFWVSTTSLVFLIGRYMPLRIDIWKERGGCENFIKILLSSLYPTVMLAFSIPWMLFYSLKTQIPYALQISTLLIFLYGIAVLVLFFLPLLPIHKQLKNQKRKQLKEINERIKILIEYEPEDHLKIASLINLRITILSLSEWPFESSEIAKVLYTILFPVISLVINIIGLTF